MEPAAWLHHLRADGAALADAIDGADLDAPVPSCPGWSVADLVGHVGTVHVWVSACLVSDPDQRPPRFNDLPTPPARDSLHDGDVDVHRTRTDALGADDVDRPVPTWAGRQTVGWWLRRQAHETAVHRWDAQQSLATPTPFSTDLGIDGVDEFLELVVPRFGSAAGGTGETIHLHATDGADGEGEWLLTLLPDRVDVTTGHAKGDVAVRGTASDLLLLLWGRRQADELEVFGDAAVFTDWRAKTAL